MTLEQIKNRYNTGDYNSRVPYPRSNGWKEGHIFDEDKSVKWNREEVARKNQEIKDAKVAHRNDQNRLWNELHNDVINALMEEYRIPKMAAEKIEGHVYGEYHSIMSDYFYHLGEFSDLIRDILDITMKDYLIPSNTVK